MLPHVYGAIYSSVFIKISTTSYWIRNHYIMFNSVILLLAGNRIRRDGGGVVVTEILASPPHMKCWLDLTVGMTSSGIIRMLNSPDANQDDSGLHHSPMLHNVILVAGWMWYSNDRCIQEFPLSVTAHNQHPPLIWRNTVATEQDSLIRIKENRMNLCTQNRTTSSERGLRRQDKRWCIYLTIWTTLWVSKRVHSLKTACTLLYYNNTRVKTQLQRELWRQDILSVVEGVLKVFCARIVCEIFDFTPSQNVHAIFSVIQTAKLRPVSLSRL